MKHLSKFITKAEYKSMAICFGKALVDFMDGIPDHEIQAATGLSDKECGIIAAAREKAERLIYSRTKEVK